MNGYKLADALEDAYVKNNADDCMMQAAAILRIQINRINRLETQLEIVSNNLRNGISKSIQKFQSKCIDEVLNES